MDWPMFRRMLLQFSKNVYRRETKNQDKIFIRLNIKWLIEWFEGLVRVETNKVKFQDWENFTEDITTYSDLTFKRVDKAVATHLEAVLYGLVFGVGNLKGFKELTGRLPNNRDKIVLYYKDNNFFHSIESKVDIYKKSGILKTEISI